MPVEGILYLFVGVCSALIPFVVFILTPACSSSNSDENNRNRINNATKSGQLPDSRIEMHLVRMTSRP